MLDISDHDLLSLFVEGGVGVQLAQEVLAHVEFFSEKFPRAGIAKPVHRCLGAEILGDLFRKGAASVFFSDFISHEGLFSVVRRRLLQHNEADTSRSDGARAKASRGTGTSADTATVDGDLARKRDGVLNQT